MKKILYMVFVALLAAATGPAWGQSQHTLGNIPEGWKVKANGDSVPVVNGTATITDGATVVLTPPYPALVKNVTLTDAPAPSCRLITLDTVQHHFVAQDCDTLTGTLNANVKISIAAGATVILAGVTINGEDLSDCNWAGITCEGDATIILKDGTTNTVTGFRHDYPGIFVPQNKTLTIKGETAGTGTLTARSNVHPADDCAAGIGAGYGNACGNILIESGAIAANGGNRGAGIGGAVNASCGTITINGGTVDATGGAFGAGIGSGGEISYSSDPCGTITIKGGTVTATGGEYGAGIGSGDIGKCQSISITGGIVIATGGSKATGVGSGTYGTCAGITIANTVTSVTAIKGTDATNSIGAGNNGSCGTVTIGGVVGAISTSPYTYPAPVAPSGAINGLFSVSSTKQVWFSQGNLRAYNATANSTSGWVWSFAENQWDYIGSSGSNQYINGSMTISKAGYVDLFCWVGTSASYDNYGIMYDNDTQGWAHEGTNFGNSTNDTLKHDWGHNPITNGGNEADIWRTPTNDEWVYLINSRTTAAGTAPTINGTADARYAKAKLFGTNRGLIIFPDTYVHPDGVAYPTGINAAGNTSWNGNQYSAADWAKMEAAGCVFLPCAGIRVYYTQINDKETRGFYASSTPRPETWNQAKVMQFLDTSCTPNANRYRRDAGPVRLVQDAN